MRPKYCRSFGHNCRLADPLRQPAHADHRARRVLRGEPGRSRDRRCDGFRPPCRAVRAHRLASTRTPVRSRSGVGEGTPHRWELRESSRGEPSAVGLGRRLLDRALVCPGRLDLPRYRVTFPERHHPDLLDAAGRPLLGPRRPALHDSPARRRRWTARSNARWKRSTCSRIWRSCRSARRASATSTTISCSARTAIPSCGTTATRAAAWSTCPGPSARTARPTRARKRLQPGNEGLGARAALPRPEEAPGRSELPTGIRPSATAIGPAPRRMITPGERPPCLPPRRTVAESPLPFTIVAGTPPRPATGRFRPQVRRPMAARTRTARIPDAAKAVGARSNGRAGAPHGMAPPRPSWTSQAGQECRAGISHGDKYSDENEPS